MIFEFRAKKFRTFSRKCSTNLSTLHSRHPDSFSERKGVFNFFDRSILANLFFEIRSKKLLSLGGSFSAGLAFQRRLHQKKRFLEKCSWVFFGPWTKRISDFCKSFQHGGWGVRKTIHVSRVHFGGKLFFGSNINLLIDKWRIVPKVSDVCWEIFSMVVKLHFSCLEE